jgi:hypothetical protein
MTELETWIPICKMLTESSLVYGVGIGETRVGWKDTNVPRRRFCKKI